MTDPYDPFSLDPFAPAPSMSHRALTPPPQIEQGDPEKTYEVLRLWWVGDGPAASLARLFPDPRGWGVLLHTVAEYAAQMYAGNEGGPPKEEAMRAIEDHFIETMTKHRRDRAQAE